MDFSISKEAFIFLCSALAGAGIYFLYDLFRLMRQKGNGQGLLVHIEDAVFWLLACLIMFFSVFFANNGGVRLYELLGAGLGALIYSLTLSKWISLLICRILDFFSFFFKKFLKILLTPLLIMYNIMYRCTKPVLRLLRRGCRVIFRRFSEGAARCSRLVRKK